MMMSSQQATHIFDHTLAGDDTREVIKSRFGDIVIDTRNMLVFPKGLLGMPTAQRFILANFPSEKMAQFKLLQCLDDLMLSFIALPLSPDNAIIRYDDAVQVCRSLSITPENLIMLLIVCVHRGLEGTRLSVNARAPVFIDSRLKAGTQYVFPQDHYKVQHFIT
jgi:flagellar assembly factor FliW